MLANKVGQELGRIASAGEKLGVRTAIGDAGTARIVEDLLHEAHVRLMARARRTRFEIVGHREIDITSTGCLPSLSPASRSVMPSRCRTSVDHLRDPGLIKNLVMRRYNAGGTGRSARAARRVAELRFALGSTCRSSLRTRPRNSSKRFQSVESEGQSGVGGDALPVDAHTVLTAAIEPSSLCDGMTDNRVARLHRFEEDRAAADFRELLEMAGVSLGFRITSVICMKPSLRRPSTASASRSRRA